MFPTPLNYALISLLNPYKLMRCKLLIFNVLKRAFLPLRGTPLNSTTIGPIVVEDQLVSGRE